MLITERLVLRAVEPKDVSYLFTEENNPEVWNLSSTIIPFSKRTFEDYANSIHDLATQKQFRFIIELKDSGKIIGMLDLFDYDAINARAGVGIVLTDLSERSKGYAREALTSLVSYSKKTLHLKQLYCSMHASNSTSVHLFRKMNFIKTGLRKCWFKIGPDNWEDEVEMQLLLSYNL